jgi:hypothetical protein
LGAVTFPDPKVAAFIKENLVPLRLPHDHKPLAEQFQVKWTPTLIILDAEGREHHRNVGFLPPEEMIPFLLLGSAKLRFDHENFAAAKSVLDTIIRDHPRSGVAPEAIFLKGVCSYKTTHEAKPLKEAYERLTADYPDSDWTKRAYPYRLL